MTYCDVSTKYTVAQKYIDIFFSSGIMLIILTHLCVSVTKLKENISEISQRIVYSLNFYDIL